MKHELTQERLREALEYSPETGFFIRKPGKGLRNVGKVAGSLGSDGYWQIRLDGKDYKAHRLAWLYVFGEWPDQDIDHVNRNRKDNRIVNLRESSRSENMQNTPKHKDSSSGYLGVSEDKRCKKWRANIMVNGKQVSLGYYKTPEEAHEAYKTAKRSYHKFNPEVVG